MINLKRRFFLFGAAAVAAAPVAKKIFILPRVVHVDMIGLWAEPLTNAFYRENAILQAQMDRAFVEAISGIPDFLQAQHVPEEDRWTWLSETQYDQLTRDA